MTEFGFDSRRLRTHRPTPQTVQEKRELVQRLFERADVLVVDEIP